jgi:hypothetical protein
VNSLKQIGLAMHNYHSINDVFPIGYVAWPISNVIVTSPGWSWASAILPQMEQQPIYSAANMALPIEDPTNRTVRTTTIATYVCPSDRFTGLFTIADVNGNPIAEAETISYAGNFGRDISITKTPTAGNGIFMCNTSIGIRQITDGSSQTIAAGERGSLLTQVPWPGAITNGICRITPGSPSQSTRTKTAPVQPLARADTNGGTSDDLFFDPDDFYSPHPAGLNFLICDGSVRFIKASITSAVYGDLCSRNLGEIVSSDGY